ncbi:MAG: antiterminator LoaP [Spirochaetaceae bacterium]|jgi:transcriptional antiterminator NusG|nr:antiterminator LoaP [Spirochaetaceae bacterium]
MKYFAAQVKTRGEEKYIKLFRALHPQCGIKIYFPKRKLNVRRRGVMVQTTPAVFPGYIFLEIDDEDSIRHYHWLFRKTEGFYRFLKSNQNIRPLEDRDLETVLHFIKRTGPLAGISRVYFDKNSRIVVVDGPLVGLEGDIIKVDKRKGRAKIKLDLYDDSFTIDLGFEMMKPAAHPGLKV